jgi:hypothetical protein
LLHDNSTAVAVTVPTTTSITDSGPVSPPTDAESDVAPPEPTANSEYAYWVSGARPVSWYVVVVASVVVTAVPDVADAGGTSPTARRTMTPLKPALPGSVHENVIVVEDCPVTTTLLTGNGAAANAASIGNVNAATVTRQAANASAPHQRERLHRPLHRAIAVIERRRRYTGLLISDSCRQP